MKYFLITLLLFSSTVHSASAIFYENKGTEKEVFEIVNTQNSNRIIYYQKKKKLVIWKSPMSWSFKVESSSEAKKITQKLLNSNDNSLIELEEY